MTPAFRAAYAAGTRDSSGAPGRRYWQQKIDYRIEATIDPATNQLRGREVISLHNTTPDTLKTIVLRLYQNFFAARTRRSAYTTDVTDGITIERLSVNGAAITLSDNKQYAVSETIATLTPAAPIAPGATAAIEAAWRFTVPLVDTAVRGQRMGRYGSYLYQIAQWYPQVAMYDDIRGWDTDPHLGNAEFYNQFGSFDVRITAPGGWLLGATGHLENPEQVYSKRTRDRLALAMRVDTTVLVVNESERGASATAPGSTLTWHFTAPMVNDFAFAVSRDYNFDATRAAVPGRGTVPVYVLYLPQHTNYRKNNTAQYFRRAIEEHSKTLFPYEFPQGTIADGPETGMEYPMIIFNGSGLSVTVHETGHQWFPMMVGSNETRYGFMDEGFTEYIQALAIARISNAPVNMQNRSAGYRRIAGSDLEAPLMWPTLYAGPGMGVQAYTKSQVALNALGGIVGDSAVRRAFAQYAREWKYKHPTPYDFFYSMNRSLGKDLDWFWYQWFFTAHTVDQSIESVRVNGADAVLTLKNNGEMTMPAILWLDFTDGSNETVILAGSKSITHRVPLKGRVLKSVSLDPENRFQDLNRDNNVWVAAAAAR
ncbi:MAG TPA: M1 family metallopeptidase [Gemmatimonadaceae bacterium]